MSDLPAPPAPAPKTFFKSRTVLFNLILVLAGAVATVHPGTADWVQAHSAGIIEWLGIINVLLRIVTEGRIVLVADSENGL